MYQKVTYQLHLNGGSIMQLLESLFFSSFVQSDQFMQFNRDEVEECLKFASRHEEHLKDTLTIPQKEMLEKFIQCAREHHTLDSCNWFVIGFSLGVKITAEAFSLGR